MNGTQQVRHERFLDGMRKHLFEGRMLMDMVCDHDTTDFVWTASQISIHASRQVEASASLLFSDPKTLSPSSMN